MQEHKRVVEKDAALKKDALLVITGAGGFIAGNLAQYFRKKGFTRIRTVDKKPLYESVRRNVQWHVDPLDSDLLAAVRRALAPVMNKQWDFDAAVDRLMMNSLEGVPNKNCQKEPPLCCQRP